MKFFGNTRKGMYCNLDQDQTAIDVYILREALICFVECFKFGNGWRKRKGNERSRNE